MELAEFVFRFISNIENSLLDSADSALVHIHAHMQRVEKILVFFNHPLLILQFDFERANRARLLIDL